MSRVQSLWSLQQVHYLLPLKVPLGPERSFWKDQVKPSHWSNFQNVDSLLASRASKLCCLSSMGTAGREEEGHPALLSGRFLLEGTALTLDFLTLVNESSHLGKRQ